MNKLIMKSMVLCMILSSMLCYGEYVVFRKSQEEIVVPDEKSYALAYENLQKYQFPESLKHLDSLWNNAKKQFLLLNNENLGMCPLDRELYEHELSYYQEHRDEIEMFFNKQKCTLPEVDLLCDGVRKYGEEKFLRIKFVQLGLDLYFIPKTLYEIFVLKLMLEKEIDGMQLPQYMTQDVARDCLLQGLTGYKLLDRQASDQRIRYTINKELIKQGINQLNPKKCKILVQQFMNRVQQLLNDYEQKFQEIFAINPSYSNKWGCFHNLKIVVSSYNEKMLAILQKAIELEYEAHEKGDWVLYRGSNFGAIEIGVKKQRGGATGVCYGHSLFAGFFGDKWACVLNYIVSKQFGYALFVNIANYYDRDNSEFKLFRLPAIDTIEGLVAQGETFHPRTRVESYDGFWADEQQFKKYLKQHAKYVYLDPQTACQFVDPNLFSNYLDIVFKRMIRIYTKKG